MEEQKVVERDLMSEEEFKESLKKGKVDVVGDFYNNNILHLKTLEATSKFRSIRRAIRRGHVSLDGFVFPDRPFNNRTARKNSRVLNERKKVIYGQLKYRKSA